MPAAARPSCRCWFRLATVRAELALIDCPAFAGPAAGCRSRCLRPLLLSHRVEIASVHAASLASHIHAHEAQGRSHAAFIGRRSLHRLGLSAHKVSSRHRRVAEGRIALDFLDELLILLTGTDVADTELHDIDAAQLSPFLAQHLIEGISDLLRMSRQSAVTDPHC